MTARARVDLDFARGGVQVFVAPNEGTLLSFEYTTVVRGEAAATVSDAHPLLLDEDVARAVYEALGQYFGGMAADQRLLRRDYEDERKRVDRLITHVTGGGSA